MPNRSNSERIVWKFPHVFSKIEQSESDTVLGTLYLQREEFSIHSDDISPEGGTRLDLSVHP